MQNSPCGLAHGASVHQQLRPSDERTIHGLTAGPQFSLPQPQYRAPHAQHAPGRSGSGARAQQPSGALPSKDAGGCCPAPAAPAGAGQPWSGSGSGRGPGMASCRGPPGGEAGWP